MVETKNDRIIMIICLIMKMIKQWLQESMIQRKVLLENTYRVYIISGV